MGCTCRQIAAPEWGKHGGKCTPSRTASKLVAAGEGEVDIDGTLGAANLLGDGPRAACGKFFGDAKDLELTAGLASRRQGACLMVINSV